MLPGHGTKDYYGHIAPEVGPRLTWTKDFLQDEGLFYNWSPTGVLEGVTLTHMDDILVTGKEAIKSSHENLLRKRTEPGETCQWGGYGEYDRVPPKPPDTGCL